MHSEAVPGRYFSISKLSCTRTRQHPGVAGNDAANSRLRKILPLVIYTKSSLSILPLLRGESVSSYECFYYFRGSRLEGVREGDWKVRKAGDENAEVELFHLGRDPRELYNVAKEHPDRVAWMMGHMDRF